ncbi:MAG: fimbria major subunit [Porphyromonas sp.]|nr:fimbria major subunit [Porphyromonas sp.]
MFGIFEEQIIYDFNIITANTMNIISRVLFLFTVMLFSGCQEIVDLSGYEVKKETEEVTLSFSVTFEDLDTKRAYPTDENEKARRRLMFENIRIVLYSVDPDSDKPSSVAYAFDKRVKADKGVISGEDLTNETLTVGNIELSLGDKHVIEIDDYAVYVFATPVQDLINATQPGTPFSKLEEALSIEELYKLYYLPVSLYASKEPLRLKKDDLKAVKNIFSIPSIHLSPLTALASADWETKLLGMDDFEIHDFLYLKADVMNKKVLLFPELDPILKELNLNYPKDANYSGFIGKLEDELDSDFVYTPTANIWNKGVMLNGSHAASSVVDDYNTYMIVPENTVAPNETNGKVATRLIVVAFIQPKEFESPIAGTTKVGSFKSWLYFSGKGYSEEEFGLKYKAAQNKSEPLTLEDKNILKAGEELKIAAGKETSESLVFPGHGFNGKYVQYYYRSMNYYAIPFTHFTKEELKGSTDDHGRFGVVRGTHYHFKIKSFSELGKAAPEALNRDIDYATIVNVATPNINFDGYNELELEVEF